MITPDSIKRSFLRLNASAVAPCEFGLRVHTESHTRIGHQPFDGHALFHRESDHVGEIKFALGIVARNSRKQNLASTSDFAM